MGVSLPTHVAHRAMQQLEFLSFSIFFVMIQPLCLIYVKRCGVCYNTKKASFIQCKKIDFSEVRQFQVNFYNGLLGTNFCIQLSPDLHWKMFI